MITLGDVVLVGYGSGDYPKLRLARIIKLLPSFAINQKFRIRFIKSGVTEYGSEIKELINKNGIEEEA